MCSARQPCTFYPKAAGHMSESLRWALAFTSFIHLCSPSAFSSSAMLLPLAQVAGRFRKPDVFVLCGVWFQGLWKQKYLRPVLSGIQYCIKWRHTVGRWGSIIALWRPLLPWTGYDLCVKRAHTCWSWDLEMRRTEGMSLWFPAVRGMCLRWGMRTGLLSAERLRCMKVPPTWG